MYISRKLTCWFRLLESPDLLTAAAIAIPPLPAHPADCSILVLLHYSLCQLVIPGPDLLRQLAHHGPDLLRQLPHPRLDSLRQLPHPRPDSLRQLAHLGPDSLTLTHLHSISPLLTIKPTPLYRLLLLNWPSQ